MKVKIILFFILLWAKNLVNSLQIPKNVVGANVFLKLEKLKVTIGFHILNHIDFLINYSYEFFLNKLLLL